MKKAAKTIIDVQGSAITIQNTQDGDFISLTDMLRAKDGDFFHLRLAQKSKYDRVFGYLGVGL